MKKCNKVIKKAHNGKSRGRCRKPFKHLGKCGNRTCPDCGTLLNKGNATPSTLSGVNKAGTCLECANKRRRKMYGRKPLNVQRPRKKHTFPCGCTGYLTAYGGANKFCVNHGTENFQCRVAYILGRSKFNGRRHDYAPMDQNTPHSVIREMMENPNCERCGEPLKWEFGWGKTPHLHHNHITGEIYGFTHPKCNPRALEIEVEKLREENKKLRLQCENNLRIPA